MNKTAAALMVALVAMLSVAGCSSDAQVESDDAGSVKAFGTVYSGSVDAGDAVVDLTPVGVVGGKLRVDIGVNTHSVNLQQFNLTNMTTLEYGGKILMPESAPALSGHHVSGTLVFGVGEPVSSFRIVIRGIPSVEERVFEWG